jgi:hypothetical protein
MSSPNFSLSSKQDLPKAIKKDARIALDQATAKASSQLTEMKKKLPNIVNNKRLLTIHNATKGIFHQVTETGVGVISHIQDAIQPIIDICKKETPYPSPIQQNKIGGKHNIHRMTKRKRKQITRKTRNKKQKTRKKKNKKNVR